MLSVDKNYYLCDFKSRVIEDKIYLILVRFGMPVIGVRLFKAHT